MLLSGAEGSGLFGVLPGCADLYFKGYTPAQQEHPALLAEPQPQPGTLLTADVAITALPDSQLPADSRVDWALLKAYGAEVAT
jgi:hypothetical protein